MKRGQLQAMETIIIVILLMLVAFIGLQFYSSANQEVFEEASRKAQLAQIEEMWIQLSYLPEFSCPSGGAETRICVDTLKLNYVVDRINDPALLDLRLLFFSIFGDAKLTINQVYPAVSTSEQIIFDALPEDANIIARSLPVTLYDPITDGFILAELRVEVVA